MGWIERTTAAGVRLAVRSVERPLGVSAWPCSAEDLQGAAHDEELPWGEFVTVNLDGWQMGVGGDSSWGLPTHSEYRIQDKGPHRFSFDVTVVHRNVAASR